MKRVLRTEQLLLRLFAVRRASSRAPRYLNILAQGLWRRGLWPWLVAVAQAYGHGRVPRLMAMAVCPGLWPYPVAKAGG